MIKKILPNAAIVVFFLILGTILYGHVKSTNELLKDVRATSIKVDNLKSEQEALKQGVKALNDSDTELIKKLEQMREQAEFKAIADDLNIDTALIEHIKAEAEKQGVPYEVVLAIGEHESRWTWVGSAIDTNGLESIGYMQINQPHWGYLKADYGLDVSNPKENITAGITILANLRKDYPLEKALVCYECGEEGAKGIETTEFSRHILERSKEFA